MRNRAINLATGRTPRGWQVAGWLAFLGAVILVAGQQIKGVNPQDEGQFLTYPWLIALGHMPYRDIWMSYPPTTYLVIAGAIKLGIPGFAFERCLGAASVLLYALIVNRALTGAWSRFSWIGFPLSFGLLFASSDVHLYPWSLGMPILLTGFLAVRRKPAIAGVLFLLAGTIRFEYVVVGCAVLALMAVFSWNDRPSRDRFLASALVTIAVTVLFYLVVSLITDGQAFRDIFVDQLFPVEAARSLPIFPLQFGALGLPILVALLAGPPVVIGLAVLRRNGFIIATNIALLLVLSHFFQRADASHLFSTAAVVLPWLATSLVVLSQPPGTSELPWLNDRFSTTSVALNTLGWAGGFVTVWMAMIVIGYAVYLSPLSPVEGMSIRHVSDQLVNAGSRSIVAWDTSEARDDRQVINYLRRHAAASDRVFIAPETVTSSYSMTDLYFPLGLTPASKYQEVQGGIETARPVQKEIVQSLTTCAWVIFLHGGKWYAGRTGPAVTLYETYVADHFRLVAQNPTYEIWRHRGL